MSETYTKHDLVKELAQAAGISKRRTEIVLETLTKVAYREAHKGFAVPGICRLDVVHRHARQVRNPQTHESLLIAEHDALRVRPLKRAKNAIAPTPHGMIQMVTEPEAHTKPTAVTATDATTTPANAAPSATPPATEPVSSAPAVPATPKSAPTTAPAAYVSATPAPVPAAAAAAAPRKPYTVVPPPVIPPKPSAAPSSATAPASASAADDDGQFVSFRCKQCGQEIEAPHDMLGAPNECPTCGEHLLVPYSSEPGTVWYRERANASEKVTLSAGAIAAMKGRTIRIDLPDDL